MKRIVVFLMFVFALFTCNVVSAQEATLSPSVVLSVPTATKIKITHIDIMPADQIMNVTYKFLDASNNPIYIQDSPGNTSFQWQCRNDPGQPVANCTAEGVPYRCCTGVGTGPTCAPEDTSFSDIFRFTIRTQDVGNTLGKGMRALIINKMKAQIPALSGVTITFSD